MVVSPKTNLWTLFSSHPDPKETCPWFRRVLSAQLQVEDKMPKAHLSFAAWTKTLPTHSVDGLTLPALT